MNYQQLPIFRTRAQAANSNRRAAFDYQLAARWERLGGRPFRSNSPEVLVDLASEGALVEPRGRPLINCQLFGTQFIRTVMSVRNELAVYAAEHGPLENIAFIRIRPSRDSKSKTASLLDAQGNAPLRNLRRIHRVTSAEIQGALEYMQSQQWLSPLVIGRHADPIDSGSAFDWHEHVTAQIDPECSPKIAGYLYRRFGRDRVWISSEEEPGVPRDLVSCGCYAPAKSANRGYDDISDEHLLEFIAQSRGLRRIEVTGPIRAARDTERKRGLKGFDTGPSRGLGAEFANILAEREEMLSDGAEDASLDTVTGAATSANLDSDGDGAVSASRTPPDQVPRTPRLLRCHFTYFDLTLRWVARVSDYAGWDDLRRRYDLSLDIEDAKALAARAADLLSLNPVIPESSTDKSLDFESLVEWKPLPYGAADAHGAAGTGRPTAQPQHGGGVEGGVASHGAADARRAAGTGRPTAQPQHGGGVEGGVASHGAADARRAAGTGRPTAQPQHGSETEGGASTPESGATGVEVISLELNLNSSGSATATLRIAVSPSLIATLGRTAPHLSPPC